MGRLSKNLSGQNARIFISPLNAEYTDDTTFAAFVSNAIEGEIGVFLDTGAVRTTALTAGLKFFVAQKRDGFTHKTPVIEWDSLFRKLRTAYTAPVKQVSTLGYNGTSGDVSFSFTGASFTAPQTYGVAVRETTPGNQPFPVQEGYATVTSATADEYTVAASIASQMNADYDYGNQYPDRFVYVEVMTNGTRTALAGNATVVQGSKSVAVTAHALPAGTLVVFNGAVYKIASVTDANNFVLDRPYTAASGTITAGTGASQGSSTAYTSGTNLIGFRFSSILNESHFKVQGTGNFTNDTVTAITAWVLGAGDGAAIRDLEIEGNIFDGVGSTKNAAFASDYGQPTPQAALTTTYHQIFLEFAPSITPSAAPPHYRTTQIERIHFAIPATGNTPDNELTTIFGV